MATFQAQVESLTSLSVSTTPTTDELTQFLIDGVSDVTNKWIALKPQDANLFTRVTSELTDNGHDIGAAKVLSAVRENGVVNNWEICREVPASMQYKVTDTESLSFASKYNPVFIRWNDGGITVYPAPGASPNRYKIFYVNNVPTFSGGGSTVASDNIHYFPIDKIYLVVLYAAIKTVAAVMGNNVISITAVPPDTPTLSTVSFSESNSLNITATAPTTISLATVSYTDAINADATNSDATNADADLTAIGAITVATVAKADISGHVPAYTKPGHPEQSSFEDFWTVAADTLLEDGNPFGDNDPGIFSITTVPPDVPALTSIAYSGPGTSDASLTVVAAGGTLGSSTQPTYNENVVDTAMALVTATIVEANNFIDSDEDIELAAAKLSEVQATINDATLRIQNELNEFNEENIKYQASVQESMAEFQAQNKISLQNAANSNNRLLQNAAQDAKVIYDNNAQAIQKYQIEVSEYQAEISSAIQEYTQKLNRYQLEMNTTYQAWAKTESDNLQVFQLDIQNELNEFNKENTKYQANIQAELAKHNTDLQKALTQAQADAADAQQEAKNAIELSKFNKQQDQTLAQFNQQQDQALEQFN